MNSRVVAIIPARLDSSRFPHKQLARLGDRSVLGVLVTRLRAASTVDEVVLATTERGGDDVLVEHAALLGIRAARFDGAVDDVLGRLRWTAERAGADVVVRANGDSPLLSPELIDTAVTQLRDEGLAVVTGKRRVTGLPSGLLGDVMTIAALRALDETARDAADREHVTAAAFRPGSGLAWAACRLGATVHARFDVVVDEVEDLVTLGALLARLPGADPAGWTLQELLQYAAEEEAIVPVGTREMQAVRG